MAVQRKRAAYHREWRQKNRQHVSAYSQTRKQMLPELYAFIAAKQRCTNPKNPRYCAYGGRGIQFLLSSWHELVKEIGYRPSKVHSLDRINNNGNYEIGNIRWATRKQQYANRRVINQYGLVKLPEAE